MSENEEFSIKLQSRFQDTEYNHDFKQSAINELKTAAITKLLNAETQKDTLQARESFILVQSLDALFNYTKGIATGEIQIETEETKKRPSKGGSKKQATSKAKAKDRSQGTGVDGQGARTARAPKKSASNRSDGKRKTKTTNTRSK